MSSTAAMLYQELEQEPFNAHEFVERHAWRTMGTRAQTNCDEFDPMSLHAAFERMIRDLRDKNLQMHKKNREIGDELQGRRKKTLATSDRITKEKSELLLQIQRT